EVLVVYDVQYAKEAALAQQHIAVEQVAAGAAQQQRPDPQPEAQRTLDEEVAEHHGQSKDEDDEQFGGVEVEQLGKPAWRPARQRIVEAGNEPVQPPVKDPDGQAEVESH